MAVTCSHNVGVVVMGVVMLGFIYRGVISRTVGPGVLGRSILLVVLIWRNGPWFLLAVACSHRLWVVVIDVSILELMLFRIALWQHRGHRGECSR